MEEKTLTFGEKAVGYNPQEENHAVKTLKSLYAQVIDTLKEIETPERNGQNRHIAIAVTEAESAQMRAVKAATWQD